MQGCIFISMAKLDAEYLSKVRILSSMLSEFAIFQTETKGNPRSIPMLVLYTLKVTIDIVQEGAAADGWDSM